MPRTPLERLSLVLARAADASRQELAEARAREQAAKDAVRSLSQAMRDETAAPAESSNEQLALFLGAAQLRRANLAEVERAEADARAAAEAAYREQAIRQEVVGKLQRRLLDRRSAADARRARAMLDDAGLRRWRPG